MSTPEVIDTTLSIDDFIAQNFGAVLSIESARVSFEMFMQKLITKSLANSVSDLMELKHEDWIEAVEATVGAEKSWLKRFERLGVKVAQPEGPGRGMGKKRSGAKPSGGTRVARFTLPGEAPVGIGEFLARHHKLANLVVPRTITAGVVPPEGKKHLSHTQVKKVAGRVFKWIVAKYGKVNGDMLFYTKVGNYLNDKLACLPSRGKTDGSDRSWALILKRRFENGRRKSAESIYKACPCIAPD